MTRKTTKTCMEMNAAGYGTDAIAAATGITPTEVRKVLRRHHARPNIVGAIRQALERSGRPATWLAEQIGCRQQHLCRSLTTGRMFLERAERCMAVLGLQIQP